jgi:hypothetical protein
LRFDQVFRFRERPTIHETLGFGQGLLVEGGNPASEGIDECI